MKFLTHIAGAAVAATVAMTAIPNDASADFIPIPGSGFGGVLGEVSGVSAYGDPWEWQLTLGGVTPGVGAGQSAWGTPGLGLGTDPFGGPIPVRDFHISLSCPKA